MSDPHQMSAKELEDAIAIFEISRVLGDDAIKFAFAMISVATSVLVAADDREYAAQTLERIAADTRAGRLSMSGHVPGNA
jgi:hypothetical protein